MALKMLAAYYSCGCDSRELFAGYKIEHDSTFHAHLNKYDVLYLNIQHFLIRAKKEGVTEYLEQAVIADIRKVYGVFSRERKTALFRRLSRFTWKQAVGMTDIRLPVTGIFIIPNR